jgi:hypothetical protein
MLYLYCIVLCMQGLDTTEMDEKMKVIEEYINTYSKAMQRIATAATGLADRTATSGRVLEKLSEVCSAIGSNCEDEDDEFIRQFGLSIKTLSSNVSSNADNQLVNVKEPLERYYRTLLSIKSAQQRQHALKNNFIATAADKIMTERAEQKDPANLSKIEKSRNSRAAVLLAKKEYIFASDNLVANFERMKECRIFEIAAIAKSLVELEVASCRKNADVLADLWDELSDESIL